MKRPSQLKRTVYGAIVLGSTLALSVLIIINWPPSHWTREVGALTILGVGLFTGSWWLTADKKWGGVVGGGVVSLLLLSRWGILDVTTFILWAVVVGLICLIN